MDKPYESVASANGCSIRTHSFRRFFFVYLELIDHMSAHTLLLTVVLLHIIQLQPTTSILFRKTSTELHGTDQL